MQMIAALVFPCGKKYVYKEVSQRKARLGVRRVVLFSVEEQKVCISMRPMRMMAALVLPCQGQTYTSQEWARFGWDSFGCDIFFSVPGIYLHRLLCI